MFLELFLVQDSHTKIKRNRYGNLGCCLPRRGIKNYWYVKKCQNLTMSNRSVLQTALEYKPRLKINLHCNPVQGQYRARTGFSLCTFSHREKPVFITWEPCNETRVFPAWEKYTGKTLFWPCTGPVRDCSGIKTRPLQTEKYSNQGWMPKPNIEIFYTCYPYPLIENTSIKVTFLINDDRG